MSYLKTPLYEIHVESGAKTGPFAGYDMPLYYPEGALKEHEWVRTRAGMFDVSHMGQLFLKGAGAVAFAERLTPSAFRNLAPGRARYTVLMNRRGGMVDDLIITRFSEDALFVVINAGRKEEDILWMQQNLPEGVSMEILDTRALIALQGPEAEKALREALSLDMADLAYMALAQAALPDGTPVFVSRLGYTGEDGFEISVPGAQAASVWKTLAAHASVKPAGLAARDTLRLEMGYPLYGHDIDMETGPVEAALSWVVSKNNHGFIAEETVRAQQESGPSRLRVGIALTEKGIAREGAEIVDRAGAKIGVLTSGGFSPTLGKGIGQGYVGIAHAAAGTPVGVIVRGRAIAAEVAPLSHVAPRTRAARKG